MTKTFGDKVAVASVDVDLFAGEIHALLGENGAGKSTVISMMSGQYKPDRGSLEVEGRHVRFSGPKDSLRHGIGVVYQDFRLVDDFSVLDNLVLGTRWRPSKAAWAHARQTMSDVGFDLPRDTLAGQLSVGEKQQLEILKLLFRGARILILDEPTAVLTPQQSAALFRALRVLADQGRAIMFVSHKLNEVSEAADRVTVLRAGRSVVSRPAEEATAAELAALMMGVVVEDTVDVPQRAVGEPVLTLEDVTTSEGRRSTLKGVGLTVRRGEIVGVAGVSGNGQTDLAQVAAGTLAPESGRRLLDGRTVAYVPEDRLAGGLVARMNIAENLALRSFRDRSLYHPLFVSRRAMAARAEPLIRNFAIPAASGTSAGELSGGGQQRTILARELSSRPDLLVICQPTRGLDVASALAIQERLLGVRAAEGGVLLISEDLDELLKLCDRVLVLAGGRIVGEFPRGAADRSVIGAHMLGAAGAGAAV
jgi:simple sugar transport system ATP-binding protein